MTEQEMIDAINEMVSRRTEFTNDTREQALTHILNYLNKLKDDK